jgi:ABC-type multidrug transport system fused ATPase/permease subunit
MSVSGDIGLYFRIYRKHIGRRMYIVFGLSLLAALTEGFGIALLLPLLRSADTTRPVEDLGWVEQSLFDFLNWIGIGESILGILAFIGVAFALKGLIKFAEGGYRGYLQAQLLAELKQKMFDTYSRMSYQYYISQNTGHFINIINAQTREFFLSFGQFITFFSQIITTLSYFAFAFVLTWRFATMAAVAGIILLLLFRRLNNYVRTLSRKNAKEMSQLNKLLVQILQSFKYIVSTHQIDHLRSGVSHSIDRLRHYQLWRRLAGSFTTALREPMSVFFIIGVIIVQVTVFEDPITPIFVSLLLFHRGMQSVIAVQSGWQTTMEKIGSVEMVDDEFRTASNHEEAGGREEIGPFSDEIVFDNVSFSYDDEEDVIQNLSLTVPANTTVAFRSESGAGKSTLIDMMTLLLKPQQGRVLIDGTAGGDIYLPSWRSQIGYVSQETVIFDDTVVNNISLWDDGDPADVETRARNAAQKAYAHEFIEELDNGYQSVVGDRGVRLSGGQRQRLFIARELYKNPNLLILDEATSALDTESERYIQQSIDALKGEMTVVIIAHRLSTIKNVDRIFVMENGRLVESGGFETLTGRDSRFRQMVEIQSL